MSKKEKAPNGKMTIKGMERIIMSTHQAAVNNALAVRKAFQQTGQGNMYVPVPGEKRLNIVKVPTKFNKRPASRRSAE